MNAKDIKNSMNSSRIKGERIYPDPPKTLSKVGVEEWNRLVNSLHITEKDIGLLTLTANSFADYDEFDNAIHTILIPDKTTGKLKKKKRTLSEYLITHDNSQRQVELTSRGKAQAEYSKAIKLLNDFCPLQSIEQEEIEDDASAELLQELL